MGRSFFAQVFGLVAAFLLLLQPAFAFDLGVSPTLKARLEIEAGLDPETRKLLELLPENARIQAVLAMREMLGDVDMSVAKYLARVDEILSDRLAELDCTIDGATKRVAIKIGEVIWPFGLRGPEALASDWQSARSKFRWDTSIEQYLNAYSPLLTDARSQICANRFSLVPKGQFAKLQIALNADARALQRAGSACSDPSDCVSSMRNRVRRLLAIRDARDVATVGAASRLDAVKLPIKPAFYQRFDAEGYVATLRFIVAVEDEVNFLNFLRNAQFDRVLEGVERKLTELTQAVGTSRPANLDRTDSNFDAWTNYTNAMAAFAKKPVEDFRNLTAALAEIRSDRPEKIGVLTQNMSSLVARAEENAKTGRDSLDNLTVAMKQQCAVACLGGPNRFCPEKKKLSGRDLRACLGIPELQHGMPNIMF